MSDIVRVLVVLGSKSDEETMGDCLALLDELGIAYDCAISSAHRNPEKTSELARNAEAKGYRVIIAAAGMAAALPGFLASQTILPVIGVPLSESALNGVDALYSMVQMPAGVPVAVMAIGKAGAKNAAILAAQILGLSDAKISDKLRSYKQKLKQG
jgi:5-(carboxyamino)imidazole ribonucleotide mutase